MASVLLQRTKWLTIVLVLSSSIFAGGLAQYGGYWLRAPLGADVWARGGAGTANASHSFAWHNPTLASLQDDVSISTGGFIRPLGVVEGYLSGEGRIPRTRVGLSGVFLYRGIPKIDSLVDEQEVPYSSTSFTTMTAKFGVSFALQKGWLLGFSFSWLYMKTPVDFGLHGNIETATSSSIGGISLMSGWHPREDLQFAFGVRNLFSVIDLSQQIDDGGTQYAISDTVASPVVVGVSWEFGGADHSFQIDSDLELYLFDSFFHWLYDPMAPLKIGITWRPVAIVAFRAGVRDILFDDSMFSNRDAYSLKSTPAFTAGLGFDFMKFKSLEMLTVNYAISGSGSGAGFDHVFDITFQF